MRLHPSTTPTTLGVATSPARPRAAAAAVAAAALMTFTPPALAADPPSLEAAAATFAKSCAGCHAGGGNVLAPGATLFPDALARGGVDTQESLYRVIYSGRGRMPGYGAGCEPKGACTFGPRLSDGEIEGLAAYVLQRAADGWK